MKKYRILEFLEEDNGKLSSSRLFALIIVITFVFEWVHHIISSNTVFTPDYSIIGLILGIMGIHIFTKKEEQIVDRTHENVCAEEKTDKPIG